MQDAPGQPATTRRREALALAEELLADIELRRIAAIDIARKAARLARLLDDIEAMAWLAQEAKGYSSKIDIDETRAALRSGRSAGDNKIWTQSLSALEGSLDGYRIEMEGLAGPLPSSDWAYRVFIDRSNRAQQLREASNQARELLDKILGSIHQYVGERYDQLRFGAAVESAFQVVRADVDTRIGALIPGGLAMLSAALENAVSDQPEHWAGAAATCRRLLKAAADVLRPPGPDGQLPNGKPIKMGEGNYINRLMDWITATSASKTVAELVAADLEYLGRRLDAADKGGHKGAHADVNRWEASRIITGTYLLLGDVLRLADGTPDVPGPEPVKG